MGVMGTEQLLHLCANRQEAFQDLHTTCDELEPLCSTDSEDDFPGKLHTEAPAEWKL